MPPAEPRAIFEAYLQAMNNGDTDALRALVHRDYTETYPQSGELIRGFENLHAEMAGHPGGFKGKGTDRVVGTADRWVVTPSSTLLRIEGVGDTFTGVSKVHYSDGTDWYAVSIGEIRDDRVWRVQTFWGETFEAPAWRSSIVERIQATGKSTAS
jgi:ketosteroid isomerase-like protein